MIESLTQKTIKRNCLNAIYNYFIEYVHNSKFK